MPGTWPGMTNSALEDVVASFPRNIPETRIFPERVNARRSRSDKQAGTQQRHSATHWRKDNASQGYSWTGPRSCPRRCCPGSRIRFRAWLSWRRLGSSRRLGPRLRLRRPLYQHRRQRLLSAADGPDPAPPAPAHGQRLRLRRLLIGHEQPTMETLIALAIGVFSWLSTFRQK